MYMHMYMFVFTCSFLVGTFGAETILGPCSQKNEHGYLGNKLKTSIFLKMARQAKPLCPYNRYRNSVQNRGTSVPRCLI